jgi:transcriptional regulator with XRE-family HTH domain
MLSIRELAEAAHVARSTIYVIEHGRTVPRPAVARRIASALGVPPLEVDEFRLTVEALRRPSRRRGPDKR